MRISDWSSDVCSSELPKGAVGGEAARNGLLPRPPGGTIPASINRSVCQFFANSITRMSRSGHWVPGKAIVMTHHFALATPEASEFDDAPHHAAVSAAIEFLVDRYPERPALEEVAAVTGLHRHHFQRVFKRWAGISPKRFTQHLTVEHAKHLLAVHGSVLG